jgi:citrate synthase
MQHEQGVQSVSTGGSVATSETELAAYLERVRARRAQLHESLSAVDLALESPIAHEDVWRERVSAAMGELQHDFADHVELTEGPDGFYDRISASAPRLEPAIERLRREHVEVAASISRALIVLEPGSPVADVPRLREELTVLVGTLRRHRQAGGDLVYEAYEVDLGGSG